MKRRKLLGLVGGAVAWPLAARGQKIVAVRHVGVLLSVDEKDPEGKAQLAGFVQRLAELGWSEGQNLKLEIRWSAGNLDQIRTFARVGCLAARCDPCGFNSRNSCAASRNADHSGCVRRCK